MKAVCYLIPLLFCLMVLLSLCMIKSRLELAVVRSIFDRLNIGHFKCFVAVFLFDESKV